MIAPAAVAVAIVAVELELLDEAVEAEEELGRTYTGSRT